MAARRRLRRCAASSTTCITCSITSICSARAIARVRADGRAAPRRGALDAGARTEPGAQAGDVWRGCVRLQRMQHERAGRLAYTDSMRTRRSGSPRVMRRRTSWCVVLFAALLECADAGLRVCHRSAAARAGRWRPGWRRTAVLARNSAAIDHGALHAGHAGHLGHAGHAGHMHGAQAASHGDTPQVDPPTEPTAPHCPYCLDFAAGAPLASALPVVPAAQSGHAPLPLAAPPQPAVRPSLRLAAPRGPPAAA